MKPCYHCGTGRIIAEGPSEVWMEMCNDCAKTKPRIRRGPLKQSEGHIESLEKLGGKCTQCGFTDLRALQIDHIDGSGGIRRKTVGCKKLYKYIKVTPIEVLRQQLQVLCANCNWIKRQTNKEGRQQVILWSNPDPVIPIAGTSIFDVRNVPSKSDADYLAEQLRPKAGRVR